jgi:hypothetical protein
VTFGVITRAPTESEGNMAAALDLYSRDGIGYRYEFALSLNLFRPVFLLGEILLLGADGREVAPPGRMPSKWDVDCEEFGTLAEAVARMEALQP